MVASSRLMIFAMSLTSLLVASSPALAQQRGAVTGRVTDPDGLVLPGATVTITERNTGFTRTVVSAENGAFSMPNLEPGNYSLTVEMPGFASVSREELALTAGATQTLELRMQGPASRRRSR